MNFVFISPHFPPNYSAFCLNLSKVGVKVLGLANEAFENIPEELRNSFTEYYRVGDMHDYAEMIKACGYFTHKYGKIDRIESLNEYWLEQEAKLRTDFNVQGLKSSEMPSIKQKSKMKKVFADCGIPVARGAVVKNFSEALSLTRDTGFPVVVKPDCGVGAAKTFKLNNSKELEIFFETKISCDYILEEYIAGEIVTYDGLTDINGRLVFSSSLVYNQGTMETVNNDTLLYYYTLREIPEELETAGKKLVAAYGLKERFFHFEFFKRKKDRKLLGLEVNMRPPGGFTTDMFNYSNDFDIYREWAEMVASGEFKGKATRKYHCCYIGRKNNHAYQYGHEEILSRFNDSLLCDMPVSGIFRDVLGDYCYLIRTKNLSEIHEIANFIQLQK